MPRKYNSKQKEYLLSPDRAKTLDTHRVMSFLPLMVYQDVADVGSGPGYFSIPLAKFLFDGQVLALDIHKQMLEAVQNEADKLKLSNITTIHSTEAKLALNKDSVDGALLSFVLSDTSKPEKVLKDTKNAVKNGGWMAIIEWKDPGLDGGPNKTNFVTEDQFKSMALKSGFGFIGRYHVSESHYMLVFST
ncbi:MAG: class I SAM-dependent methyltransferase [SAR202 cluster bacterium]|nr:class I SAM-dependent methyltransferase [SAR202 cluster bacterium]